MTCSALKPGRTVIFFFLRLFLFFFCENSFIVIFINWTAKGLQIKQILPESSQMAGTRICAKANKSSSSSSSSLLNVAVGWLLQQDK